MSEACWSLGLGGRALAACALPLALAGLVASCAGSGPVASGLGEAEGVTVSGRIALLRASLATRFGLLQAVTAPQASDVKTVRVFLTRLAPNPAGEVLVGSLPGVNQPIELRHLKQNTTYRVRLEADDMGDARIDHNATDAGHPDLFGFSETKVITTMVETQGGLNFRLRLKDVVFDGTATGNVAVTAGQVLNPLGDEVATLPSQIWPDVTGITNPAIFMKDGLPYVVDVTNAGDFYVDLNPRGSVVAGDFIATSFFADCGGSPAAYPLHLLPDDRLFVSSNYMNQQLLGFTGAMDGANLVSVPKLNANSLRLPCLP